MLITPITTKIIGCTAGLGTTVSFVPQLLKVVRTNSTEGISVYMFLVHTTGLTLWIVYGTLVADPIVIAYNATGLLLCLVILAYTVWNQLSHGKNIDPLAKDLELALER